MIVRPRVGRWQPTPVGNSFGIGLRLAATLAGLLAVYLVTLLGLGALAGAAAIAALLACVIWSRPFVGLMALVIGGTFHQTLMLLIFHFTGWMLLVRGAQAWKELVVAVLLARVVDQAFRRRRAPRVYLLDLAIIAFLAYGCLYLLYPSSLAETTLTSQLFGLRANAFFLLAYFIGRGVEIDVRRLRALLATFSVLVVLVAAAGVAQFLFPGAANSLFDALSFPDYVEAQRGDQGVQYVVRQNDIQGLLIPRASSFFLSDLGLAFYSMLAAPLMVALFLNARRFRGRLAANILMLAALGTAVLTVTRSAMAALVPMLAAMFAWRRALPGALLLAVEGAAVVAPLALYLNLTPALLRGMFSPDEASVQGHLRALDLSIAVLLDEPFGRGLGTAGQVAQRFTPQGGITNESWYLQLATEMGVLAALLFLAILVGFGVAAFVQTMRVRLFWLRSLCLGMAGAAIGFGVVGLTLHAWENLTISILFWLFAGLVVRAQDIEAQEVAADAHRRLA
jgi:hypothetical protein